MGHAAADATLPGGCKAKGGNTVVCSYSAYDKYYTPEQDAVVVGSMPQIKALRFEIYQAGKSQTELTDNALISIGRSLNSTTLTSLDVFIDKLKQITPAGIAQFSALNPTAQKTLTTFSLDLHQVESLINDASAATIGQNLGGLSKLNTLSVNVMNTTVTSKGISSIAAATRGMKKLNSLTLLTEGSSFSLSDVNSISGSLASLTQLKYLNLQISQSGLKNGDYVHLLAPIAKMTRLQSLVLNFASNLLGDVAFGYTVKTMQSLPRLKTVDTIFDTLDSLAHPGPYFGNTFTVSGVKAAIQAFNKGGKFKAMWGLSLANTVDEKQYKAYASAIACLDPKILSRKVSLYYWQNCYPDCNRPDFIETRQKLVNFKVVSSVCASNWSLESTDVGGPNNQDLNSCVQCSLD